MDINCLSLSEASYSALRATFTDGKKNTSNSSHATHLFVDIDSILCLGVYRLVLCSVNIITFSFYVCIMFLCVFPFFLSLYLSLLCFILLIFTSLCMYACYMLIIKVES